MQPQNNQNPRHTYSIPPQRQTTLAPETQTTVPGRRVAQQQATANIIRGQIDYIYQGRSGEDTPHTTPVAQPAPAASQSIRQNDNQTTPPKANQQTAEPPTKHGLRTAPPDIIAAIKEDTAKTEEVKLPTHQMEASPYKQTMANSTPQAGSENTWQQYHEAWQKYYQLYYERHFLGKLYSQQKTEVETPKPIVAPEAKKNTETLSSDEAMSELRQTIRQKVIESTKKVKKSRHFAPVIAGFAVLFVVAFLQWNRVLVGAVAAYTSPGNIEPQNIITSPVTDVQVGPEPKMIIPKINVDAPVVYGVGPDHNSQMTAMEKGIAHFSIPGANAVPGQVGNTVMAAHSSNDIFAPGDYKVVFARNEKLVAGDVIYMHYEGVRYTYSITHTEVVLPTEVSKVQLDTDKPMLTLISCVPLGTAQKRLLVFAEQVSPDPNKAAAPVKSETEPSSANIPGRPSPTVLERLFGSR